MKRIVFHIGRGGRFHNAGHKYYSFCMDTLDELLEYTGCSLKTKDEEGKSLPDDEWAIIDECEEEVLKGREAIESDCIKIDIDGDFDTYIIKPLEECDDEEISILADEYFDNTFLEDDDIEFNYGLLGLITDDDMHRQLRRKNSRLNRNEEYFQLAKKIIEDDFLFDKNGNIYFSGDHEKSRALILKELINGYAYCIEEENEEYQSLVPLFGFTVGHTKKYPKKIYRIENYKIAFLEDM